MPNISGVLRLSLDRATECPVYSPFSRFRRTDWTNECIYLSVCMVDDLRLEGWKCALVWCKNGINLHKKNNKQGSHKHCEAMHFKSFDLTFRMLQHTFSKVFLFENTTERASDLVVTKNSSDILIK